MKAAGMNTAHNTRAMAINAEPTSSMLRFAASRGARPAAMLRSTFSTTTIASSTTIPIARTRPNSDRLLSENPKIAMKKKVPISDTGIATIGMMAARQVCIEVGAELERHVDLETAISGRVRGHVDHVLDAVDLLLEGSNHGGSDHVCARPGILTADPHHRRRDLRILGDRQPPDGHRAEDDEDDRDDRGEDRPVDEEVGDAHSRR